MAESMYLIGRITSTHGIRGELKVQSSTDFDRFKPGKIVYMHENGQYIPFEIKSVREHKQKYLVQFVGKENINDVLMYKGLELYTDEVPNETLADDEYLYDDLIGKRVETDQLEMIGIVSSLIEVPQGHLLEVKKTNGKTVLIPFVSFFVQDITKEVIRIKPIEGLL